MAIHDTDNSYVQQGRKQKKGEGKRKEDQHKLLVQQLGGMVQVSNSQQAFCTVPTYQKPQPPSGTIFCYTQQDLQCKFEALTARRNRDAIM